jgi:hypothetical protein
LYFIGFGRKSVKFQDYNEAKKLTFGKIQLQIIFFEFKKREFGKILVIFGKNRE